MKHVLSISLGSSSRDTRLIQRILGQEFIIERRGTDGDKKLACELLKKYDGSVDAFGLGGTDLYIYAGNRRYTFSESAKIVKFARQTPIVDGSGVKNTLERKIPDILKSEHGLDLKNKKVLLVCAVDRFGLAEALDACGAEVVYGDLIYGLGVNIPLRKLSSLANLAKFVAPIITKLPIKLFYPIGSEQEKQVIRHPEYFDDNEVIAGDFHLIKRYMPDNLEGKIIITNTVTTTDLNLLKKNGVMLLVTTTPQMQGRSFGTNVLEALLVAANEGKRLDSAEYDLLLNKLEIKPRVEYLY